jgi:hypothetical protein
MMKGNKNMSSLQELQEQLAALQARWSALEAAQIKTGSRRDIEAAISSIVNSVGISSSILQRMETETEAAVARAITRRLPIDDVRKGVKSLVIFALK